jgi:hypothetical protein
MNEDWRMSGARSLRGARLQRRQWQQWSGEWDHDHCSACGAKFGSAAAPDILHEGYTTCGDFVHGAGYEWICPTCFSDLKAAMGWVDVPPEDGPIARRKAPPDKS